MIRAMSGHLDRTRAGRLMAEQGLDALVLAQPESIIYAAGAFPGVATFWRRAGAAFLIVPADPLLEVTAIVGDLQAESFKAQSGIGDVRSHRLWVETGIFNSDRDELGTIASTLVKNDMDLGKLERLSRPAQYDIQASLGLLRDRFIELGFEAGSIGLEMGFVPAADFLIFQAVLPKIRWTDATRLVERLRSVKTKIEITKLRLAAELARAGIEALVAGIEPGMDASAMTAMWREATFAEAMTRGVDKPDSAWAYIAVGGDGFAPGGPVRRGDVIKIDVGCVIDGYSSDCARTAVLGGPNGAVREVYDALRRAFDHGLSFFRPGTNLADIYHAVAQKMWDQGFTTYGRGHFGHGLGASIWSEEWPFIAARTDAVAEPGMMLAFETPYYVKGLGGFIIEDQFLIGMRDVEVIAPLPRDLIEIRV